MYLAFNIRCLADIGNNSNADPFHFPYKLYVCGKLLLFHSLQTCFKQSLNNRVIIEKYSVM